MHDRAQNAELLGLERMFWEKSSAGDGLTGTVEHVQGDEHKYGGRQAEDEERDEPVYGTSPSK